jgi:hypothetical protein
MKAADHGLAMTITYTDLVSNLSMKEDWHDIFFFNRAKNGKDAGLQTWVDNQCSKYSGCILVCLVILLYITILI